jgi:hypothetical protein
MHLQSTRSTFPAQSGLYGQPAIDAIPSSTSASPHYAGLTPAQLREIIIEQLG